MERDTVDQVAQKLLSLPAGSRWYALFPVNRTAHPDTKALGDHLFDLRKKGFNRLFQEGRTFEFSTPESLLDIDFAKPVFVLIDRLAVPSEPGPEMRQRMVDTVEISYREAGEIVLQPRAWAPSQWWNLGQVENITRLIARVKRDYNVDESRT